MANQLPVSLIKEQLVHALRTNNRLVVRAPAGSGKSVLIPQYICDHVVVNEGTVMVLQPRRIATRMLASYIAKLRNTELGKETGYKIRHENMSSASTRILFVTEGILRNQLMSGDTLKGVAAIIFDEFHERHLETDLSLALALQLQDNQRNDLKLVVMSATLETSQVQTFMGNCPVIETDSRSFPIAMQYKQPVSTIPLWEHAAMMLEAALADMPQGNALVFMPGAYEIQKTIASVKKRASLSNMDIYALHGSLTKDEQDKAVNSPERKIIVTTNVAETSLTIPGITLVVDSGMARVARFDAKRGINTLFTEPISTASANQRAGRAGRTAPGTCIRLWSEFSNSNRIERLMPEIHRVDLSEAILGLMASGVASPAHFKWLEKPSELAIDSALKLLKNLNAINTLGNITKLGTDIAALHMHPRIGRMLMHAKTLGCIPEACIIAAIEQSAGIFSSTSDPVVRNERDYVFGQPQSDLIFELHAWVWAANRNYSFAECSRLGIVPMQAKQIAQLALQLMQKLNFGKKADMQLPSTEPSATCTEKLRECIFTGYADQLAIKHKPNGASCQMVHGRVGVIHAGSIVKDARYLVVTELEETKTKSGTSLFFRKVTEIDASWLTPVLENNVVHNVVQYFDATLQKAVSVTEYHFNDLLLKKEIADIVHPEQRSEVYTQAICEGVLKFPQWNEEVEHFVRRVNFVSHNAESYAIPAIDEAAKRFIIQQAIYKCRNVKELQQCNVWTALKSWLSNDQLQALDFLAPQTIRLPMRKYPVKLYYDEKGDVVLSETIQGLYDCATPVMVCDNKVAVVFEILSPGRRPVQITRDLEQFWKQSYLAIKKELKGRYPKHEWR